MRFLLHPARAHGVRWWVNIPLSPSPYSNLSAVLRALVGAMGGWRVRGLLSQALMLLLYRRLSGIYGQMERLASRFAAGRLWRGRTGPRGPRVVAHAAAPAARIWPGRFGWLVRAASFEAAGYGSQLRAVLGTPEMVALLVAAPQAARILRPVCRMLAVETSLLRPNVPEAPPKVRTGRNPVRPKRAAVEFERIPLPRGVLVAARRQGFHKRS